MLRLCLIYKICYLLKKEVETWVYTVCVQKIIKNYFQLNNKCHLDENELDCSKTYDVRGCVLTVTIDIEHLLFAEILTLSSYFIE